MSRVMPSAVSRRPIAASSPVLNTAKPPDIVGAIDCARVAMASVWMSSAANTSFASRSPSAAISRRRPTLTPKPAAIACASATLSPSSTLSSRPDRFPSLIARANSLADIAACCVVVPDRMNVCPIVFVILRMSDCDAPSSLLLALIFVNICAIVSSGVRVSTAILTNDACSCTTFAALVAKSVTLFVTC